MAQGQIKKSDLVQDNVLAEFNKELKQTIANVNLLKTAITATAQAGKQIKKGIGGTKPKDVASMKEVNKLNKTAEQNSKNRLRLSKQLQQAQDKEVKAKLRYKKATQDQAKALKLEIELEQAEIGSLKRLRLEQKKLREEKDRINITTKEGQRRMKEVNRTMNKNNKILDQNATKLGKLKNNIGNYKSALGGLRNALAQLGLAFGVFALVRESFNVVKDFEQSQADLASVLGISTKEMAALTEQAKELGATTTFTASQVGELQKELAKLGFTQQQIQAMTEATLLLAEATGTDLARAAEVTGATIRGFGLAAEDTQRVVDVMAKSFSSSSLDMEKFATGMATVAPIAKQMGFSLEDTTALLGVLTDRGIDASTAGTGLRNMFLNASKEGMTLNEALEQVNNASDKTGESFDLFGKRGATLGVILAENQDAVGDLTKKLLDADGAAKTMADTQRNTLGGAIKLLKSAWEGMILKMDDAGGVGEKLRKGIAFLADNLESIVKVIGTAIKIFATYKAIVLITAGVNAIMGSSLVRLAKSSGLAKAGMAGITRGVKRLGAALKANAIGLAIAAIVYGLNKLRSAYKEANKDTLKYAEIQEEIAELNEQSAESLGTQRAEMELLVAQIKLTNNGSAERIELIKELNDKYGTNLKNIKDETEFLKALDFQQQLIIGNLETEIRLMAKKDEFTKIVQELAKAEQGLNELMAARGAKVDKMTAAQVEQRRQSELNALAYSRMAEIDKKVIVDKLKAMSIEQFRAKLRQDAAFSTGDIYQKEQLVNKLLADKLKLEQELTAEMNRGRLKRAGMFSDQPTNEIENNTNAIEDNTDAIDDNVLSIDEFLKKWDTVPTMPGDQLKLPLIKIDAEDILGEFERELDKVLKDKELKLLKSGKTEEEIARALLKEKLKLLQQEIDFKKSLGIGMTEEQKLKTGVSTIDLEIQEQKILRDLKKKNQEEIFEITRNAIDLSTQYFLDQKDKEIAKIEEVISAAEKQADVFRELAMNGNITAKESLAEQNRLIAEANREKAEEERKKQLIEKGSAILLAFNAALEGGDKPGEAFLKAITTVAGLDLFISALSFMGGTEDTGLNGSGVDGKGGFHAILHPKEGVLKREHNERKLQAGLTNETMLNSALKYQNLLDQRTIGSHIDVNTQLGNGWDSHLIVDNLLKVGDKLDTVTKAINDKPVYKAELGKSMSKMMEIKETIERGNRKTTNTFVVKQ